VISMSQRSGCMADHRRWQGRVGLDPPRGRHLTSARCCRLRCRRQGKRLLVADTHGRGAWVVPTLHRACVSRVAYKAFC